MENNSLSKLHIEAPSTRLWIFLKTHLLHLFWIRVTKNEAFQKRSPGWIFLKTKFSSSHVDEGKRSFSNTLTSQHRFTTHQSMRLVFLGITREHFACMFSLSKFESRISLSNIEFHYRIENFECHNGFVWMGIFSQTVLV